MKNRFNRLFFLFIAGAIACLSGGMNAWGADGALQAAKNAGVPDNCYIVSLHGPESANVNRTYPGALVYYNTSTQQNINAKSVWDNATRTAYFYVPASESPVSLLVSSYTDLGYKSVVNTATGEELTYAPQIFRINTSDLQPDQVCAAEFDHIENVRSARINVTVDNPDDIIIQNRAAGYLNTFTADKFKDGKLTIDYDPKTETTWYVGLTESGYICKASLDGAAVARTTNTIYLSSSQAVNRSSYRLNLDPAHTQHTLDITTVWPDFEFPTRFVIENVDGNETNATKLQEKIKWIKVDGVELDRSVWSDGKTFNIKNGSVFSFSIAGQVRNQFEVKTRTVNGKDLGTQTAILMEGDNPFPVEFKITALVNNPVRFTVNTPDYDKINIEGTSYDYKLTGETTELSHHYLNNKYQLLFIPVQGYYVSEVKVGDQTYNCDRKGIVTVGYEGMDGAFDVKVEEYKREVPVSLYVDGGSSGGEMITFNHAGANQMTVSLSNGRHTLMLNPLDFPIYIHETSPSVYVDGVMMSPVEKRLYIEEIPVGKDVRIFSRHSSTYPVTINSFDGTITMDGKEIEPGTYFVLPGTEFIFTPAGSAAGKILQTDNYTYIEPVDGKFTFHPTKKCDVTLRDKAVATFNCDDNWINLEFECQDNGESYRMQDNTTTFVLPEINGAGPNTVYTFSIVDPWKIYRIKEVTSTPVGATYDRETGLLTLKAGMTVNLTTELNPKPFFLNVHVIPAEYYYTYDPEQGKYGDLGGSLELASNLYMKKEPGPGEEPGPMTMAPYYLRYGDNNFYRDYTQHDESDERATGNTSPFPKYIPSLAEVQHELFNLTADEFPVTIYNDDDQYDAIVFIDGNIIDLYKGDSYTIERPESYNCDVRISLRSNDREKVDITFNGGALDYYYRIDSNDEVEVKRDVKDYIYSFSTIRLRPAEGLEFEKVYFGYSNSTQGIQYYEVEPDSHGEYVLIPDANNFQWGTSYLKYGVKVEYKTTDITVETDGDAAAAVRFNGLSVADYPTVGVQNPDNVKVTCNEGYRITSVVDKATGRPLPYDDATGIVSGLSEGMSVIINVEEYKRDQTLTVLFQGQKTTPKFDAIAPDYPSLYLAPGTPQEATSMVMHANKSGIVETTVKFNPGDAPFDLRNVTYSSGKYQAEAYLNNVRVEFKDGRYNFPAEVPDNSTLLILRPNVDSNCVGSFPVDYEIEEGLKIDALASGIHATSVTGAVPAPVTSVIKVVARDDNRYEYAATYSTDGGTTYKELPADGYTIALTDKQLKVKVVKTYNTVTFVAAEGTDLDAVTVEGDGETFPLSAADNVVCIPTHIKAVKLTTSEPDSYLTAEGTGMNFDADHGLLSGLTDGTVTLRRHAIVRENEVMVFLDNEELSSGTLVLGSGKVIESSTELSEGFQSVKFGEDDLPIIYRIAEIASGEGDDENPGLGDDNTYDPSRPETMPAVYVNGERLDYSPEYGGYVFPVEALTGDVPPVIKIFAPDPDAAAEPDPTAPAPGGVGKISLFYIVENGISFEAVEDYSVTVTEPGIYEVLPSTHIDLSATSGSGDPVYVEVDGSRVEPVDGKYTIMTGNADMTIAVKVEKLKLTFVSDEWQSINISGNGFSYPMYSAESQLEFPLSTTSVRVFSEIEGQRITGVADESGAVKFDIRTGELTGFTNGSTVTLTTGDYTRDIELMIYLEESQEPVQITHLILGEGTSVEKEVAILPGYRTVMISNDDLPLAVKAAEGVEAVVFLNNELLEKADGEYKFPAEMPEGSIVKIFTAGDEEIARAEVHYDFATLTDFTVELHHDHVATAVDATATHRLLPGTEITFTVTPKAKPAPARVGAIAPKDGEAATEPAFTVTANDEEVEPQEDGSYMVKINDDHIANGLSLKVAQPQAEDPDDPYMGIDEVMADGATADVYTLNGTLIARGATKADIAKLPAGIYIIGGEKIAIGSTSR